MIQNSSLNNYGSINKIGTTNEGRVVYEVKDEKGKSAGKLSVAQPQCDIFERSYNEMMTAAPETQKFAEKSITPEWQEKSRKTNMWSKLIGASAALLGSALLTKKFDKYFWKAVVCLPCTLAGYLAGAAAGIKLTTPKEVMQFTKSMQTISKLDVQPYRD